MLVLSTCTDILSEMEQAYAYRSSILFLINMLKFINDSDAEDGYYTLSQYIAPRILLYSGKFSTGPTAAITGQ